MIELTDNLMLYRHLSSLPSLAEQQAEYARLLPELRFNVKAFGYLMKKGAEFEALHGEQ